MIPGVVNLRDLGGTPTAQGRRIRHGLVFRSGHLGDIVAEGTREGSDDRSFEPTTIDHQAFDATGIRHVFDLRGNDEVVRSPDKVPSGVQVTHLDVLADSQHSMAAHLEEILADPVHADRVLRGGLIDRHYEQTYRDLVRLDSARSAYSQLFSSLVAIEQPALFHCTAGKDRTGWAAACLLWLIGVDDETVRADYLRSNEPVRAAFAPLLDQFAALGGDPELIEPAFLVRASYLDAALVAMREDYGTVETYFERALGLDPDAQAALRERLLEPAT